MVLAELHSSGLSDALNEINDKVKCFTEAVVEVID